jgi:hypothetical protein
VFVLATQFIFETIDQALDADLKNARGHADRPSFFATVGKNRQDSGQGTGAALLNVARDVQKPHVKLFEIRFGKLRIDMALSKA